MRKTRGFTLIELLVAMSIFGIISMLALGGLNTIIQQQTLAREQMVRLGQLDTLLDDAMALGHPRLRHTGGERRFLLL